MNLVDLYNQTPEKNQRNIKVVDNRVFVKNTDGTVDEYLVSATEDGEELWLVRSDREQKQDIRAIKSKLGI